MHEILSIKDKIIIVTGASSGFGAEFCKFLAMHGARVVMVARRKAELLQLQKQCAGSEIYPFDLYKLGDIPQLVASIVDGVGLPDVLINNAGTVGRSKALDTTTDEWHRVMELNANALRVMSTEVARHAINAGRPCKIVNIASTMAFRGIAKGSVSYTASKAVVKRLTEVMAHDWGQYGITVNAICPGFIKTNLNREYLETTGREQELITQLPLRRLGQISDLLGMVLLLCSPASDWITGSSYIIDGGQSVAGI